MGTQGLRSPARLAARRFGDGRRIGDGLLGVGLVSSGLIVFGAPLLVGSVHPPAVILVLLMAGLGAALTIVGEVVRGRSLRVTPAVLLPLFLVLIPLLQIAPLPAAVVNKIDPVGAVLLADSPVGGRSLRSLSLDSVETRAVAARSAAVLAVFLVALHLASGRSRRQLLIRIVAASSIAAVAIGLGHRILGEQQIYGHFPASRGLLNGPFINSNHTAEFLELGAFVCIACALAGASALNRVGWLTAAVMAGAGALGALSRGAIVGLAAGTITFVWLQWAASSVDVDEVDRRPPRTNRWVVIMLVLLAATALALGADQILTRVATTEVARETRLAIWRDSLTVLMAHPLGIGRGVFQQLFPVYRTFKGTMAVRFEFVENEPLQYLVETGWIGFLALMIVSVLVAREWIRSRRSDPVEAALVASLVAVLVHNVFDFGLETLGIQIPFAAVLGTLLGRTSGVDKRAISTTRTAGILAVGLVAMVIGAGSVVHANSREFDSLLEKAARAPAPVRRELALRAEEAHPVDYYYALAQAGTEPIAPDDRGRSPRLHALNHALLLCPHCPEIHSSVAATLWALGRRKQALDEWHTAMDDLPIYYPLILQQVWAAGARPEEIAVITGGDPERLLRAVAFLISRNQSAAARKLLPLAAGAGASPEEVVLLTAKLDIDSGSFDSALRDLAGAQKRAPQDPRVALLLGEAYLRAGRVDEGLRVLEVGVGMNPHDLPMVRRRLEIIIGNQKWHLAKDALAALESALAEAQQPTIELHLATARYYSGLRDYPKASSEYNLVITQDPSNLSAWLELGALWEGAGRVVQALDAYRQANSVVPGNPTVVAAIARLESRIQTIRSISPLLP